MFIESCQRNEFRRAGIEVPFEVEVIGGRGFQMRISLTVEIHAYIAVRRYCFGLRQRIGLACPQAEGMFLIQIIFQIEAGQEIVFPDGVASFGTASIHIIIYIDIYIIILQPQVYNPTRGKLISSFGLCRMDILGDSILVHILLNLEPAGR